MSSEKEKSAYSYLVGSILKRQRGFREAVRSGSVLSFVDKYGKFDTPVNLQGAKGGKDVSGW